MAYKVKKGDTLSAIAKAASTPGNKVTVNDIVKANPEITNPSLIRPGQVFKIPSKGATGPTGPTGSTGTTGSTGVTLTDAQIRENERAYQKEQDAIIDAERKRRAGQSAYDLLLAEFNRYGLGTLLDDVKDLIVTGADEASLTLALRQTKAYQARFAANKDRINNGLRALSEAEYVTLEDQYQNVMRNYGLPASYYTKDATGKQAGFEKFIAGDVSAAELEDRISIAQKRVIDAAPQVKEALKQFYPDIKDGDILAYTLDPTQGLANIQKKVLAAEIGGAAMGSNLGTSAARAEELARYGVTAETARAGFGAIGGGLERGRQLSSIYQQPDYNQAVAEEEVFNLPGQTQAGEKRKKIIGLEKATFGGQTGVSSGALSQNRAGSY
jgi:LysM repeat protein